MLTSNKLYPKWIKLFLILSFFAVSFTSCDDDEDELTDEQIEEQRIEEESRGLVGIWDFASSQINTSVTANDSDEDYRNIRSTLSVIGGANGTDLEFDSDGTYKVTNGIIGGGTYTIAGNWELRKGDSGDIITLDNLYQQLFARLEVDRDFFDEEFANDFNTFEIISKSGDEIELMNKGGILEETGSDAPPANIAVTGEYSVVRR